MLFEFLGMVWAAVRGVWVLSSDKFASWAPACALLSLSHMAVANCRCSLINAVLLPSPQWEHSKHQQQQQQEAPDSAWGRTPRRAERFTADSARRAASAQQLPRGRPRTPLKPWPLLLHLLMSTLAYKHTHSRNWQQQAACPRRPRRRPSRHQRPQPRWLRSSNSTQQTCSEHATGCWWEW